MLDSLRQLAPLSSATRRWRSLGGLTALLLGVAISIPRAMDEPQSLLAIGLTILVVSAAWLWIAARPNVVGVGVLGGASTLLMLLLAGPGAVIGAITAIVTAGLRLPTQPGLISAVVVGLAFVLADGYTSRWTAPASVALSALGLAFAYVAGVSVRRIREERETAQTLLAELQRTREAQIEAATLGERSRLAREIHDVLAHTLSALTVQLEGTRMLLEQRPGDPAAVVAVERAHRLARDGLDETRRAVAALRGDLLPGPEALGRLADDFQERKLEGTPCHFLVEGDPTPLDPEAQLALYRTAQEALTNVHKHARATSVDMRLRYLPDGTELVIEDVAPIEPPEGRTNGGYGLIGMRERAELVGGDSSGWSSPKRISSPAMASKTVTGPVIRVLVADDQTVVREGLVMLLGFSPGVEVVAAAADGDEATQLARRHRPDVVLMDLRMPRCDGVAATRRILAEVPTTRVIVLTTYADDESVFAALEAGARGYLTKDATASEIQHAIRTVFAGEALLEPSVQRRLLERSLAGSVATPPSYPDGLTQREVEVLKEIAAGHSNREIAERLSISEATVKTHVNNIFSKAGLRDRAQAVVYAIRRGLAS